jgi:hypothetical protein
MSRSRRIGRGRTGDTPTPVRRVDVDDDTPTPRPSFDPAEFARQSEQRFRAEEERSSKPTIPLMPAAPLALSALEGEALDPATVPALVVAQEDLEWFDLSSDARALLAHVDGVAPLAALCERANLTTESASELLLELTKQGLVSLR